MRNKKVIAAVTALALSAVIYAEPVNIDNEAKALSDEEMLIQMMLPEWVPQDMESAVEFLNKYGTSHSEGTCVCLVYNGSSKADFSTEPIYTKSVSESDFQTVLTYGQPPVYDIAVFRSRSDISANIDGREYSFKMTEKGYTETDIFSWLPDCKSEFVQMSRNGENIFVHDGKIVFLRDSHGPAGYSWITLSGEKQLKTKMVSDCNTVYTGELPVGGPSYDAVVLEPVSDGFIDLHMIHARSWDIENSTMYDIHKYFKVSDNCTVIEETDEKPDVITDAVFGKTEYSFIDNNSCINYDGFKKTEKTAVIITSYEELRKYAGGFLKGKGLEDFLGQFDEKILDNNVLLLYAYNNEGDADNAAPFSVKYDGDEIKVQYYMNSWGIHNTTYLDIMSVYFPKEYYSGQKTVWEEIRAGKRNYARISVMDYDTGESMPSSFFQGEVPF